MTPPAASSRHSSAGAGWGCTEPGSFITAMPTSAPRLSWFNPRTLWTSRNDVVARLLHDPVPEMRRSIVAQQHGDPVVDLSKDRSDVAFLLLGDTGEGDKSQYAVTAPLVSKSAGTAFMFICSDVLYPLGNVNEYGSKFYKPYQAYAGPIYAIPGNHDWYDGLAAFLWHLCDHRVPAAGGQRTWRSLTTRSGWSELLWRPAALRDENNSTDVTARSRPPRPQPGPYFVIDTAHVRLVCIDTGIRPKLDAEQGAWLVNVSRDPRPKLLLTGTPIWVNGKHVSVPIDPTPGLPHPYPDVDAVVTDPQHRYVAAIGGDTHNYQHYPVRVGERVIHYVVSGGGGAYMSATHTIPSLDGGQVPGVEEADFRCYPLRRDSLAAYSRVLDMRVRKLLRGHGPSLVVTPDQAAAYLALRLGVEPLESRGPGDASLSGAAWAGAVLAVLMRGGRRFHNWFSPYFDWDEPPFFKSFLRLEVGADRIHVRCYGVSGCREHETDPPVEDEFSISLM